MLRCADLVSWSHSSYRSEMGEFLLDSAVWRPAQIVRPIGRTHIRPITSVTLGNTTPGPLPIPEL
jgi:hypothetical protein